MWVWAERGRGRAPGPADGARLTPRQSPVWVHRACFLGLLTLADWTEALRLARIREPGRGGPPGRGYPVLLQLLPQVLRALQLRLKLLLPVLQLVEAVLLLKRRQLFLTGKEDGAL